MPPKQKVCVSGLRGLDPELAIAILVDDIFNAGAGLGKNHIAVLNDW